jgi:hypothetical protein
MGGSMIDSLKTTLVNGAGQLKALLVGINRYSESNPLSYCVQDAESLAKILSDPKYTTNNKENIRLMTDNSEELDKPIRSNIINNMVSLSKTAQPTDTILFFYAGHGMEISDAGFILPSDFRQETGAKGGISFAEIKDEFVNSKARFKVLLFDACHSGSVKGRAESGIMTESFFKSLFPAPKGFAVVSSCNQQEYSYEWEEKGHGVFSHYLLQGLKGYADENHDGIVDLSELHHYLTPLVQEWAFHNGKVQTPVIDANFSGLLPLTKAATLEAAKTMPAASSSISRTILVTETEEVKIIDYEFGAGERTEESLRESMHRVNAALLNNFKPSQLNEENDNITFPAGHMQLIKKEDEANGVFRLMVKMSLDCTSKHLVVSESILGTLDDYERFWYGIGFEMEKCKFNMDELKLICDNKGYIVEKFQTRAPQSLVARVENWISRPLTLTFTNDEVAIAGIEPVAGPLPVNFYSVLNPKNFLEIFGSALVSQ